MNYYFGVDIGNTKSHALLADEHGQAVGFSQAGPGSWEAIDWSGAREVLNDITNQAVSQAGISKKDIRGAGFGFAGYDWPEDRPGHDELVNSLELTKASSLLGNDTHVGLAAGSTEGWGVVVVAGTSNNCRGWDRNGREGRVSGHGSAFGEFGGAVEIVDRAISAVAMAWSRRGPQTALSQALIENTSANDVTDLLGGLVRNRYEIPPSTAPLVFEVAEQGDTIAKEIIRWAGRELGSLANGVIRQLALEYEAFEVVLSGSLYQGSPILVEEMRQSIHALAPGAHLVQLKAPPVVGGVILGMEQVNIDTSAIRQTLIKTTNDLMRQTPGMSP